MEQFLDIPGLHHKCCGNIYMYNSADRWDWNLTDEDVDYKMMMLTTAKYEVWNLLDVRYHTTDHITTYLQVSVVLNWTINYAHHCTYII